jgi:hypothetical protein
MRDEPVMKGYGSLVEAVEAEEAVRRRNPTK